MALKKRFVWAKTASLASSYIGASVSDDDKKSVIFAGTDNSEAGKRDIITQGASFVLAPLDAREAVISGVDAGKISTTAVTQIQSNTLISGGITLNNLNTAISQLNSALTGVNADVTNASKVTLKKVDTPETGWAAQYKLYQGVDDEGNYNTAVGATINIPKDQFLKSASYIAKAEDDTTAPAGTVFPALKFTWQLTELDGGESDSTKTNTDSTTYVSVKDLVDTYVGYANSVTSVTGVTLVNAGSVSGATYTAATDSTQTVGDGTNGKYVVTTSLEETTDTNANGAGKAIKVTLNEGILKALAEGESALGNAETYTDNAIKNDEYNFIGKGETVVKTAATSAFDSTATSNPYSFVAAATTTLGSADAPKVTTVLNTLQSEIETNLKSIISIRNANAETDAVVESLRVQEKEFTDTTIIEDGKSVSVKNVTLYGDEIALDSTAFATSETHELGLTATTKVTDAIVALEAAWEWEEITTTATA